MNRKPGDWNCKSCSHLNFRSRDSCQRCGDSKLGGGGGDPAVINRPVCGGGFEARAGDWYCCSCGNLNFANRAVCHRCGGPKIEYFGIGDAVTRPGWKTGDWICTRWGCNEHNFASRVECFRCNAPRQPPPAGT